LRFTTFADMHHRVWDYIDLGQVPREERGASVGQAGYDSIAVRECRSYIQAIRNTLGQEPSGAVLVCERILHDFVGPCYTVLCQYDPTQPDAVAYALRCERQAPLTWREGGVPVPVRNGGSPTRY
jgi:hypothetical protein